MTYNPTDIINAKRAVDYAHQIQSKTLVLNYTLYPKIYTKTNKQFTRFIESLTRWLKTNAPKTIVLYAREYHSSERAVPQHYHLLILADGQKFRSGWKTSKLGMFLHKHWIGNIHQVTQKDRKFNNPVVNRTITRNDTKDWHQVWLMSKYLAKTDSKEGGKGQIQFRISGVPVGFEDTGFADQLDDYRERPPKLTIREDSWLRKLGLVK